MVFDENFRAGPPTALETLTDFMEFPRVTVERSADQRDIHFVLPHQPGVDEDVAEFADISKVEITGRVRHTDAAGAVTHAEGAEGHVAENASTLRRLFTTVREPHILRRDTAHPDTVDLKFRHDLITIERDQKVRIVLRGVWPYWRSTTLKSQALTAGTTVVPVLGDSPIADAIFHMNGPGTVTYDRFNESFELLTGSGATTVNCRTRTIIVTAGGADNSEFFVPDHPWWMILEPSDTIEITSTVAGTVEWRDSYG